MIILGIESSCDETAAAILRDGELLSNVVVSQIDIFKSYGGVIPEVAARSHLEAIMPVIDKAFLDAKVAWDDIDAIAVTHTPGLLGSLLIGTLTARTLAILHDKPLYAVHHLKSHIYSNWLEANKPSFPLLALVISGGHTQIIYMKSITPSKSSAQHSTTLSANVLIRLPKSSVFPILAAHPSPKQQKLATQKNINSHIRKSKVSTSHSPASKQRCCAPCKKNVASASTIHHTI